MKLGDVLLYLIEKGPGRTEKQLAEAVYGEATQQKVNGDCKLLESRGFVNRIGNGGNLDPYRYYISSDKSA